MGHMAMSLHFLLIHGICHAAWCWYKIIPMLESAGHNVTALDMAACGINLEHIEKVCSFSNYSAPLLDFLKNSPPGKQYALVRHSLGGMNLAYAMEAYPDKIIFACFVTAYMPDVTHERSYVIEKVR
ncbi:(R)-mandelonitrile lyase [Sarracenia purpurea var. burkii]